MFNTKPGDNTEKHADKEAEGFKKLHELKKKNVSGRVTFWTNKGAVNDVEVVEKI
jgi:hypothetical protein